VGSVMACCLYELAKRNNVNIDFLLIVRDIKEAKQYLFRAPEVVKSAEFIEIKDFKELFNDPKQYSKQLKDTDVVINTAIPEFNEPILKLATEISAHYCDLASDMYNEQTLKTLQFPQQRFHKKFQQQNLFGLINLGISPGVTNFLIGEKLAKLQSLPQTVIRDIHLFLLEQINSQQIVFSWSPKVALEELEEKPRYIQNNKLVTVEPFSDSVAYEFPHSDTRVEEYPIYQEEVLSLHQTFPQASSIRVSGGGSDVELVKNLFQLNLLSKRNIECMEAGMSVEKIVRMVLPGMKSPQKIEQLLKEGVIKSAQFAAMAEITLEIKEDGQKPALMTESIGLSFHRYADLLGTPYSGATYISYPTGVGAAILLFYTHELWQKDKNQLRGILRAEELPPRMDTARVDLIKREMCAYKIDFISHTHSFTKNKNRSLTK